MAPWILIAICALTGAVLNGGAGFVVGLLGGVLINVFLGFVVRKWQGGLFPKNVRRDLIMNLQAFYPDAVAEAFPGLRGEQLFKAMNEAIEKVGRRAVSIAPSNAAAFSGAVVMKALLAQSEDEPRREMKTFYFAMSQRIAKDWYHQGP